MMEETESMVTEPTTPPQQKAEAHLKLDNQQPTPPDTPAALVGCKDDIELHRDWNKPEPSQKIGTHRELGTQQHTPPGTPAAPVNSKDDIELHRDWNEPDEKIIRAPYDYVISHPGKDIRKKLLSALNFWLQVDEEVLDYITRTVSLLHNASLLVDDIQDNSNLRRGYPTAHRIYGSPQTINSANYVYFLALQQLSNSKNWPQAAMIFNEELLNLHRGQGMDLFWRDTFTVPTEADYLKMISNKTGGLFRLALRLMQAESSQEINLLPLIETLGLIFQIRDDYENLCSDEYSQAKGFCEDLTEGKFSFPIIHAVRTSPFGNNEVLNILKLRTEDLDIKRYAVSYMRDVTKSFDYTRGFLDRLYVRATSQLSAFEQRNFAFEEILHKLVVQ